MKRKVLVNVNSINENFSSRSSDSIEIHVLTFENSFVLSRVCVCSKRVLTMKQASQTMLGFHRKTFSLLMLAILSRNEFAFHVNQY